MKTLSGKGHNREWYRVLLVMLFSVAGLVTPVAKAQEATANVNGVVKDPTGAAIANAEVELANVNTGFVRTTSTNSDGAYDFPSIVPGVYTMRASAAGFSSVTQPAVTLQVSQTATFDFQLSVGKAQENVTVNASEGAALETSTSELGTVVSTQEVSDLPLNGRNFTQLLTITAGVANINRDQNSNGGGNWAGNSLGSFSYPAVNGARNRSNFFVLDGANDLDTMESKYNFAPIVDAIQEFKTQGHNDLAEYGGAAGGIVSVVTKSGTNEFHGTLWEFLRNQVMDATGYFNASKPPLRQNQYGASVGGPISIPKLYNGKNRTFFFAAWEGYRFRSASETGVLGPTDAERGGDFSALSAPIYDPTTTTFNGTSYTRETFTQEYNEGPSNTSLCNGHTNCIPASRINPISALYQSLIPHAGPLVNGSNIYSSGPQQTNQDSGTLRADQNFGNNDQLMFRYSQFNQQVADATDIIGQVATHVLGHNYIGHWTHTFSPTAFSDVYFGRNYGDATTGTAFPGENAAFIGQLQTLGMSTAWMTLNNTLYAPQWSPDGYIGLTGSQLQETGLADDWQYGGSFTKILGRNTIKAGADFQTNNFRSPIAYSQAEFGPSQTAGLGGANQGVGGDSWASMLVGVPYLGNYRNILEKNRGGWIDGVFVQDQFKASSHLTVNLGFRDDMVWTPIYGTGLGGNFYTGNANPVTGLYELNALPPTCSATQGAPCIPNGVYTASSTPGTGQLPPSAYVDPSPVHRVIKNSFGDWAGRLGLDYRLNNKTVIRGSYSRFYDAWATVVQLSQNFGGNWPAVNTIDNSDSEQQYSNGVCQRSAGVRQWRSAGLSHQRLQPGQPMDGGSELQNPVHGSVERRRPARVAGQYRSRCQLRRLRRSASGLGSRHECPPTGARQYPSPSAIPLYVAAVVRSKRGRQPLQRSSGYRQQAHRPWRDLPGGLHAFPFGRRWLRAGLRRLSLHQSLQPQGRLWYVGPKPGQRVLGGLRPPVAVQPLCQQNGRHFGGRMGA